MTENPFPKFRDPKGFDNLQANAWDMGYNAAIEDAYHLISLCFHACTSDLECYENQMLSLRKEVSDD